MNVTNQNQDLFNYANHKLKELCKEYKFTYLDLSKIFDNNPKYFNNSQIFIPNNIGYEKISQIIVEKIKNN